MKLSVIANEIPVSSKHSVIELYCQNHLAKCTYQQIFCTPLVAYRSNQHHLHPLATGAKIWFGFRASRSKRGAAAWGQDVPQQIRRLAAELPHQVLDLGGGHHVVCDWPRFRPSRALPNRLHGTIPHFCAHVPGTPPG